KNPLENRVWYSYPGQTTSNFTGASVQPTASGRVLDDGSTQLTKYAYDSYYNLVSATDPVGRVTQYTFSPNHVDLLAVSQALANGSVALIAQYTYNGQHLPVTVTDAAGQTTLYKYNSAGQLTSVMNPLGQTTSFQYDASHNLTSIANANNQIAASYT